MSRTSIIALVLLHFLWQGVLIQGLLAFGLHVLRPRSSTLRYALGVTAMLLMALAPVGTAVWLALSSPLRSVDSSVLSSINTPSDVVSSSAVPAASELPSASASATPTVTDALSQAFASLAPLSTRLAWLLPWLVAFWLAGVVILAARLLGGWLHLRNIVSSGQAPDSRIYEALVLQLRQRLRVSRPVRIIQSAFVHAPAVIGWLRPVLLIPASMSGGLTVVQLETILAHELAHIRRHDYAVNLFQSVVETLLFYHPAVWWMSRQIRDEREHCCDDLAVATSGDARLYASALLQLETLRVGSTQLALAATGGGNLLHRVRRLLVPASRGSDSSRWLAGIVVLCGTVFVTGAARLLNAEPEPVHEAPNATTITDVSDDVNERGTQPPDTVIIYRGTESLAARWDWARRTARDHGFREYWIGYVIEGDISRGWHYMNRHSPVRADGGVTFTGHMRTTDSRGLIFSGDHLGSLVPDRAPSDLAILFGFSSRAELDRIHAGNFTFNVPLGRRALIWLGEAEDQPSIRLVQQRLDDARTRDQRHDLFALIGMHSNSSLVRPVLAQAMESENDELRADLVEWLGYHADERTLGLIARLARNDRSSRVRSEAAETVGEIELRSAFDTLVDLARTLRDTDARREAVEGLGHRDDPRALEVLKMIAERDESTDMQREAVETLGELKDDRVVALIAELARSHENPDVRREAVETLGERAPIEDALRMLRRIIEDDRSVDIQREAVETLAEREDRRVLAMLSEIAEKHREVDVQRAAIESLGHFAETNEVRRLLERLARTHPHEDGRRAAIETLAESLPDKAAKDFFENIVQGDGSRDIKMEALEALSEMKDREALTVIIEVAQNHPDRELRKKAIQLLGDSDDPRARTALERLLRPE